MTTKKWEEHNDMAPAPTMGRTSSRGRLRSPTMAPQQQTAAPQKQEGPPPAFEEFLTRLQGVINEIAAVRVQDRAGWIKIENFTTGHKVYINKGVTAVTRVESSLPPDAVKGAQAPEFYNGRIASLIPPTVEAVSEAIRALGSLQDHLPPARRRTRDMT